MKKSILNSKIPEENKQQMENMYNNLKSLRKVKKLSIEELSKISGINKKTLMDIEAGEDFEIECLFKLCRIYNIIPYKIFSCVP